LVEATLDAEPFTPDWGFTNEVGTRSVWWRYVAPVGAESFWFIFHCESAEDVDLWLLDADLVEVDSGGGNNAMVGVGGLDFSGTLTPGATYYVYAVNSRDLGEPYGVVSWNTDPYEPAPSTLRIRATGMTETVTSPLGGSDVPSTVVGAADIDTALSDGDDASYVTNATDFPTNGRDIAGQGLWEATTIPDDAVIAQVLVVGRFSILSPSTGDSGVADPSVGFASADETVFLSTSSLQGRDAINLSPSGAAVIDVVFQRRGAVNDGYNPGPDVDPEFWDEATFRADLAAGTATAFYRVGNSSSTQPVKVAIHEMWLEVWFVSAGATKYRLADGSVLYFATGRHA
jgi:hypothetical protein